VRQIILDTETTGINPQLGHRIIEIGCVEMIDRKLTGKHFHVYVNPQRIVEDEAISIHGITNEFLLDKPVFKEIAGDFYAYIKGAELVIHNAAFDVGFINNEFSLLRPKLPLVEGYCEILDTLAMARKKHPGQKNSLDALCKRYGINNAHRELHGALLDAEILADVYLLLSGGQTILSLDKDGGDDSGEANLRRISVERKILKVVLADDGELSEHSKYLEAMKKGSDEVVWNKFS
jgi:DNA polymerase-3 subunit epsilon